MEAARLLFTFFALLLILYTIYLAHSADYAERHYPSKQRQTCTPPPFCPDRASLLPALRTGERCMYRWFDAEEICLVLERFGAVVFVGDEVAGGVYEGFKTLLHGGEGKGTRNRGVGGTGGRGGQEGECACSEGVSSKECLDYTMRNLGVVEAGDQKVIQPLCSRTPHTYLPLTTAPTPTTSPTITTYKSPTYSHSRPWQPSPLILSFSQGSNLNVALTTAALDEWRSLALDAERNIPLLLIGPLAISESKNLGKIREFEREMVDVARERHFEVLGLYDLTLATGNGSRRDGNDRGIVKRKLALVEAMMVINWLTKLETS